MNHGGPHFSVRNDILGRGYISVDMPRTAVQNGEIRNPNIEIRNKFKSSMFK